MICRVIWQYLVLRRCEMQTRWESESAPCVHIGGGGVSVYQCLHSHLLPLNPQSSLSPLNPPSDPPAPRSKWCVDRELSKHLGVRFGRAGSALEVFFKCKGVHFKARALLACTHLCMACYRTVSLCDCRVRAPCVWCSSCADTTTVLAVSAASNR